MDVHTLLTTPTIQAALQTISAETETVIDLAIAIQQVPAPTFAEHERARFVQTLFEENHLLDIEMDELGNVYGRYPGHKSDAPVIVSAHSDTVFAADTDLTVRREPNKVYGPGIGDNSMGVAGLVYLITVLTKHGIKPKQDIWFVVNVGEEGLGDLNGMRSVTDRFGHAGAFIVIEGGMFGCVLHEAIGVRRYRVRVTAEGGHSWNDFGRPSAIHVLSHIISTIDRIDVPTKPKTTYNVGVIEGGRSVNTIAQTAEFLLDLRSEEANGLAYLITRFERIVAQARLKYDAEIVVEQIGDRPAGRLYRTDPLVKKAAQALKAVGWEETRYIRGSTDANIPLSRGLAAVCIGLCQAKNAHRLDEFIDTINLARGMSQLLLLVLSTAELS